jgi:choline monooxygenase
MTKVGTRTRKRPGSRVDAATQRDTVQEALDQGYTLPATWYVDPSTYAREQQRIFRRSWQYAGMAENLAQPGDFMTCLAGDVPIVVVREGINLRAFINVCRHRGAELVRAPSGRAATLQCHYHAWTYNLDGSLHAAPGAKDEPGFEHCAYSLVPARVETWGPFVFVNPAIAAPPLATVLGSLPALVAQTGLPLDRVRRRVQREYTMAANWKVVVDNYLECYHCPVAHPTFSDLIDVGDYHISEYEYFSTQTAPMRTTPRRGSARTRLYEVGAGVEDGFYAFLWPNFTLNIYPGPGNLSLNLFLPEGVDRTRAIYEYCFVDEVTDAQVEDFARFIDQVQEEDIVLCESVERGLRSGYLDRGKLMLTRESALRHFQKLVYRALDGTSGATD